MADNLIQSIFEKKYGLHDYPQQWERLLDPDETWRLETSPEPEYVIAIRGYKFQPDELGKVRVSVWIDGVNMVYRIPITDEFLEFYFDTPRIVKNQEEIYLRNLDGKRSHKVTVTRYYEIHTKEVFDKAYAKVDEIVGLK